MSKLEPDHDCPLCPRLAQLRQEARALQPEWFNAPVPTFGSLSASLLIVGLAPGLRGANRTGRPFTGDYAGNLLYATLLDLGFATGCYDQRADDGLRLVDCAVTNAVRCVPPQNKPTPAEIRACRTFLDTLILQMAGLRAVVALGRVAHDSVLKVFAKPARYAAFGHARRHELSKNGSPIALFDSYHCSRYNTNTGVLTETMFYQVFEAVRSHLRGAR